MGRFPTASAAVWAGRAETTAHRIRRVKRCTSCLWGPGPSEEGLAQWRSGGPHG